ncbi:FAD-dependent monooxygenase spyC [Aspergillus lucknowensis]|uniref:FAD-binding domain-containing protein n=1 Tax=Aspergillus lucknowensis TaxID=176173 RepID=A0ABR4LSF8_9EURO
MDSPLKRKNFKVIIVGGSIAGLSLAHCLTKLGVDYIVLEKRPDIAPQEGASVGILPHGGRILDQLGLFDEIERNIEPLTTAHIWYPDGFSHTNRSPMAILERFGLPLAFLERRKLLQVLYNALPDTSKVLVGKTVVSVEQTATDAAVAVHTVDGSVYHGDLVVGADGVHSRVRREMWRLAEVEQPGLITSREKDGMKVDYVCIFGISDCVSELQPGEQVASLHNGRSFLTFPGKDGRVFWFLLKKLDRQYSYSSAPRWSKMEIEKMAERYSNDHIWNGIRFGDLWKRRQSVGITNLEENIFPTWHWGRIVCIGDSMHKMAPNTGQGANCAIEDAAALANAIETVMRDDQRSSEAALQSALHSFAKTRYARVQEVYKSARLVVRLHARESLLLRLVGRYYLPYSGDLPADTASKTIAGGVEVRFLAPSLRSGPGWEKYRPKQRRFARAGPPRPEGEHSALALTIMT